MLRLPFLPQMVAGALPLAFNGTVQIACDPACTIRILDVAFATEEYVFRLQAAALHWCALLARAGIQVNKLDADIHVDPARRCGSVEPSSFDAIDRHLATLAFTGVQEATLTITVDAVGQVHSSIFLAPPADVPVNDEDDLLGEAIAGCLQWLTACAESMFGAVRGLSITITIVE